MNLVDLDFKTANWIVPRGIAGDRAWIRRGHAGAVRGQHHARMPKNWVILSA